MLILLVAPANSPLWKLFFYTVCNFFLFHFEEFFYSIATIGTLVVKVRKVYSILKLLSANVFLSMVSMALDYFLGNVSYIAQVE